MIGLLHQAAKGRKLLGFLDGLVYIQGFHQIREIGEFCFQSGKMKGKRNIFCKIRENQGSFKFVSE